jgi:hypothetical protein
MRPLLPRPPGWFSSVAAVMFLIRTTNSCALICLFVISLLLNASARELVVADFNSQSVFNNFSGDHGAFARGDAQIRGGFDTTVFFGPNGAALRLEYSVPLGFCGVWGSILGKQAFPQQTLNFTNLYYPLKNSADNPSRIEKVRVTHVSFWARGDGRGDFEHRLKMEIKSPSTLAGDALFVIPNDAQWRRYDFSLHALSETNLAQVKNLVFVVEDWRNNRRTNGTIYLDDVSLLTDEPPSDPARWGDDALLDVISHRAFAYFLRFTDDLGFALDRSTLSDMVSVGTIGFQLGAYCIGHQRGWGQAQELEQRVETILKNLEALPMGPEADTSRAGYRGFYYHFLAANTGRRKDSNVELSIYDTMLLMYGVLACKEYFPDNAAIQKYSQAVFDRVEWDWFIDRRPGGNQHQFHLDWLPEGPAGGTYRNHIDGQTDEAFMVDVLALGSRTHPAGIETYRARTRSFGSYPRTNSHPILVSWRGSMFNYFFASCWLNFESRGLDLHVEHPVDIWRNNRLAIEANRRFCLDHAGSKTGQASGYYTTYGPNAWGLTACDNLPGPRVRAPSEYFGFGALPSEENVRFRTRAFHAGTIAVYGPASSINYTPSESLAALRHFFSIPRLWSPLFGFGDAYSLDPHYFEAPYDAEGNPTIRAATHLNGPWINSMSMGVNVGPMLLAIENYRTGLMWSLTRKNPEIADGLDRIFGIATIEPEEVAVEHNSPAAVRIRWKPSARASEYAVYGSTDLSDWRLLAAGIKGAEWVDQSVPPGGQRFYLVKAIR